MRYIQNIENIQNIQNNDEKSLIIVRMMTGKEHTLLMTERDETYHDVKVSILPHLNIDPPPFLRQLVFKNSKNGYDDVDDRMIVYNNNNNIQLELIIADPVWTEDEQDRINSLIERERVMLLWCDIQNIPSEIEMFLWGMRRNSCVKSLWIDHMNVMDVNFMNVINDHDTIEDLTVTSNGMNADEMSEFFDMIVEKNTNIYNFSIMHNNTYRLDDLSTLLRKNISLHNVTILNCDVEVSENSSILSDVLSDLSVLSDTHPFEKLDIFNSRIFGDEKSIKALIDSLQLITLSELDISDNEIKHLCWVRNNL
jgi:hypothetical protein